MTFMKAKKGLKKFFNEFFDTYRNPSDEKLNEFRLTFQKAMKASRTIFGDEGFRLRRKKEPTGTNGGEWVPRVNASIFGVIAVSFTNYDLGALTRRADSIFEAYIDLISTDDVWVECVTKSTGDPTKIEYAFTIWNDRLRNIMNAVVPNDAKRLFSRELKKEMFQQDNTCKICKQKITLINDAAMDHELEY